MTSILERALADQSIADTLALKLDADKALGGVGYSLQDMTADRTKGVTYTNTSGKPIWVEATSQVTSAQQTITAYVDDLVAARMDIHATRAYFSKGFVVPDGSSYRVEFSSSSSSLSKWMELR